MEVIRDASPLERNRSLRLWWFETVPIFAVILSLWVKMILFSLSLRELWAFPKESIGAWVHKYPEIFSSLLASLLLLFCWTPLMKRSKRFVILIMLDLFLTMLVVADLIYARH